MTTTYGLDYSARELSPAEIADHNRRNPHQPVRFLIRYIGYPTNRKCISHYPGALPAHERAGTLVLLVHQVAYQDFAGGYAEGARHARIAVTDAERAGWKHNRPIFAALDRYMNASDPKRGIYPISLQVIREYMLGFRSVLGDLAGLYGFYDVMGPAVRDKWVNWFWQCGAESALVKGVQFYQWNNGRVYVGGLECDLNKCYVDLSLIGGEEDDMPEPGEFRSGVYEFVYPQTGRSMVNDLQEQTNQAILTLHELREHRAELVAIREAVTGLTDLAAAAKALNTAAEALRSVAKATPEDIAKATADELYKRGKE
jgi:hypothetical protein